MVENASGIDWSVLRHCWGQADNIPDLLRQLAGASPDGALDELWESVIHQGTVYSASAPCLPFLAELAQREDVDVATRVSAVGLIYSIGMGTGYWLVHDTPWRRDLGVPEDVDAQKAQDTSIVEACRTGAETVATQLLANTDDWPDQLVTYVPCLMVLTAEPLSGLRAIKRNQAPELGSAGRAALDALIEQYDIGAASQPALRRVADLDDDFEDLLENGEIFGLFDPNDERRFVESLVEILLRGH